MMGKSDGTSYSVVIPILNEEEILYELWQRLEQIIPKIGESVEVIFVDDGSTDSSFKIMLNLSEAYPEVKVIKLSRNFGHQCALTAGIDNASGKAIILMDGDLQDSPEAILNFIDKWKEGYDVVYAIRRKRKENFFKRLAFSLFYRVLNTLAGMKLPVDAGIFSLIDAKVATVLRNMPERNRYLTGLRAYAGFRQIGIPIERGPRYKGVPRVTLTKLLKLAFDGIFSFSIIPLRAATYFGFLCATVSFLIGITGIYFKIILHKELFSWAYGLTTTFFMGGIQLIFLGLIGEYIGRIYDEVKQRPYYVVDKKLGFKKENRS